ncbi:MAG: glycosyltransferase family 39 protein [Patescibacteria group bacterium]
MELKHKKIYFYLASFIILSIVIILRISNLFVPFERDEGLYAYIAQRLSLGDIPYKDVFDSKPPMIDILYWIAFRIFGESELSVRIFMNIYTFAGAYALYLITKRIFSYRIGLLSAITFLIVTMSPTVFGQSANTEIFMALPIILAISLLWRGSETNNHRLFFLAGLLLGLAYLTKQVAIFYIAGFIPLICLTIWLENNNWKNLLLYIGGAIIPFGLSIIIYFLLGALQQYYEDTILFSISFAQQIPNNLFIILHTLIPPLFGIIKENIFLTIFALVGLHKLVTDTRNALTSQKGEKLDFISVYRENKRQLYFFFWILAAILATSGGYRYYPHYFIFIVTPCAVLVAIGIDQIIEQTYKLKSDRWHKFIFLFLMIIFVSPFFISKAYWLAAPNTRARILYSKFNPFSEARIISSHIKENTNPADKIFIIGSEPEILFLSQRQSASKYAIIYPLTAPNSLTTTRQIKAMEELVQNKPAYIIIINSQTSILKNKNTPPDFFQFIKKSLDTSYILDGIIIIGDIYNENRYFLGKLALNTFFSNKTQYLEPNDYTIELYKHN